MQKFLPALALAAIGAICFYALPHSTGVARLDTFAGEVSLVLWVIGTLSASGSALAARERVRHDIATKKSAVKVMPADMLAPLAQLVAVVVGFRINVCLPAIAVVVQCFTVAYIATFAVFALRLKEGRSIHDLRPDEVMGYLKRVDTPLLYFCWPTLIAAILILWF